MARPLRIISIDGTKGSGKSSQIGMLARLFRSNGVACEIFSAGKTIPSGLLVIDKIKDFLAKNQDGIAILDGSIARMMVSELIIGKSKDKVVDEYKHLTHAYERLDHEFGIAAFLMVMDDLAECERRLNRQKHLLGVDAGTYDLSHEADIINGMRFFNNHVASKNMTFRVVDIENDSSMLEINKNLLQVLSENYTMPKIKKDDSDW